MKWGQIIMIAIGSDHAGFAAKEQVKSLLAQLGLVVRDFGCFDGQSVHYPDYGRAVAQAVSCGECPRGILICGTGIGMSIVANKFPGIRAALCHDAFTAACSREHNDANILVMGARVLSMEQMAEITRIWLDTPFAGGRHAARLAMIEQLTIDN
jgi:ribose 5-phosphate isomerase B